MVKFKIGDPVRALVPNDWVEIGWEGVVQENSVCPYVYWDNGQTHPIGEEKLQLITKTNNMNKVKIAVSLDNDSEKIAYLKYCESIGKVWRGGKKPTEISMSVIGSSVIVFDSFNGESEDVISYWSLGTQSGKSGHTVVPFKVFAALKGIDYKPEVSVKLNDQYNATILDGKVKVGCQEFEFERIEELYKAIQDAKN